MFTYRDVDMMAIRDIDIQWPSKLDYPSNLIVYFPCLLYLTLL